MNRGDLLERLAQGALDPHRFTICAVLGHCYLARSPEGRSALLVACSNTSSALARTSGSLLISARSRVTFSVDERNWTSAAVVLELLDESVVGTFVALALDVAEQFRGAEDPTIERVFRAIAGWERLLRSRATLSEEHEIGLWGELTFILQAPSLDAAIRTWTADTRSVIDFAGGGIGIEVKTSTTCLRHSISHRQARSGDGDLFLLFASIWAVPDPLGRSLGDLVTAVGDATGEVVTFEQRLLSLGFSRRDSRAYTRRFSLGAPIAYFPSSAIPRIRSFDAGISAIRYVIELEDDDALDRSLVGPSLSRLCGLSVDRPE
jgi:hypothetical protein